MIIVLSRLQTSQNDIVNNSTWSEMWWTILINNLRGDEVNSLGISILV